MPSKDDMANKLLFDKYLKIIKNFGEHFLLLLKSVYLDTQ